MKKPAGVRTLDFKLEFTPQQKAELEIQALASNPELIEHFSLGGPMTPEMVADNKRRRAEYERRWLAIIKKYGVAEHYLKPLREQKAELEKKLKAVDTDIAALEAL